MGINAASLVDDRPNSSPQAQPEPQSEILDEFPELGFSAPSAPRRMKASQMLNSLDPSRSRWSTAAQKSSGAGTPLAQLQAGEASYVSLHATGAPAGPRSSQSSMPSSSSTSNKSQAASRIPLRPPTLIPTLQTGKAASAAYTSYRSTPLAEQRNKCREFLLYFRWSYPKTRNRLLTYR